MYARSRLRVDCRAVGERRDSSFPAIAADDSVRAMSKKNFDLEDDVQLLPVPRTPALQRGKAALIVAATALALTAVGCGDDDAPVDGGPIFDAGISPFDAGPADLGPAPIFDAGISPDSGPTDFDAGLEDAGAAIEDAGAGD